MRKLTKAIIPAAGLGTRFLPATKASPKEMLPLVDKPLIQYVVEEAVAAGIKEIIIVTGRGKRAIEDHFDTSFELEEMLKSSGKGHLLPALEKISRMADFCYIRQPQARGLGHAILCAKNLLQNEDFAVILGDDIVIGDPPALGQMVELYERNYSPIIGLQRVAKDEVSRYGIVDPGPQLSQNSGLYKVNDLVEKPSPEDAPSDMAVIGRYIITPEIFDLLEKVQPGNNNEIQLTDALRAYAQQKAMYGLILEGRRFDAGDKLGFLKANVALGLQDADCGAAFREYLSGLSL